MRRLSIAVVLVLALPVLAQQRPADLQPVPEPPPPPPGYQLDPALEPQVTILRRGEDKVEEFRINGRLYMIKVTPPHGVPYYLIDEKGDGRMSRQESLDSGLRVPMWVIGTF
jgi:hypothetical protein